MRILFFQLCIVLCAMTAFAHVREFSTPCTKDPHSFGLFGRFKND